MTIKKWQIFVFHSIHNLHISNKAIDVIDYLLLYSTSHSTVLWNRSTLISSIIAWIDGFSVVEWNHAIFTL